MKPVLDPHPEKGAPWYREPWPWILLSLPLAAVVAGIATLVIAIRSEDGLVAQDYYKRGLEINRVLEKEGRAAALGIRAELALSDALVEARVAQPQPPSPALTLRFVHPTRSGEDRKVALALGTDGHYRGELPALATGRWLVQLEDAQRGWRMAGLWWTDQTLMVLTPRRPAGEDG